MKTVFGDKLGYMVVDNKTQEPIYASDLEDWDMDEFILALADSRKLVSSDHLVAARDLGAVCAMRDERQAAQEFLDVHIEVCTYDIDGKVWVASDGAMCPDAGA